MSSDAPRLLFNLPRISHLVCGGFCDVSGWGFGSEALGRFVPSGMSVQFTTCLQEKPHRERLLLETSRRFPLFHLKIGRTFALFTIWQASLLLGLLGLAGVTYILIVFWLASYRLPGYQLVLSDWLWYTLLPLVSYSALVVAALLLPSHPVLALFIIAVVTLLLLFIGILNVWDVVTYTTIERPRQEHTSQN